MQLAGDIETPAGTLGELFTLADEVEAQIGALLDHSGIRYYDINADSSDVWFVGWNPYRWTPLTGGGQRARGEARKLAASWKELGEQAIRASAAESLDEFEQAGSTLDSVLVQDLDGDGGAVAHTIEVVRQRVRDALDAQRTILANLPSAHGEGGRLLVPDTNALIYKPELENWQLGPGRWTLVLVPQVVRELDVKKMDPRIGTKAEAIIGRLKDYGRRGDTFTGVRLAGDVAVREVAIDADMSETLRWLRSGHADDELLASVLELRWSDLRADIQLVTRDRNLQNKARLARMSYRDVENL
jgi:hypothetical protein